MRSSMGSSVIIDRSSMVAVFNRLWEVVWVAVFNRLWEVVWVAVFNRLWEVVWVWIDYEK